MFSTYKDGKHHGIRYVRRVDFDEVQNCPFKENEVFRFVSLEDAKDGCKILCELYTAAGLEKPILLISEYEHKYGRQMPKFWYEDGNLIEFAGWSPE